MAARAYWHEQIRPALASIAVDEVLKGCAYFRGNYVPPCRQGRDQLLGRSHRDAAGRLTRLKRKTSPVAVPITSDELAEIDQPSQFRVTELPEMRAWRSVPMRLPAS